jgi:transmembrane sensor
MGSSDEALSRLGRRLDEEQEALLLRRTRDPRERERFIAEALARRDAPSKRLVTRAHGAAAVAMIAAAALLVFLLGRRPLTFRVGPDEAASAGVPGAWIATPPDGATPVRFSDGTRLEIQPQSRARVASVDSSGGRVVLENGVIRAAVIHRPGARWLVDSGPFEVRVTGTRFDVRWNPTSEELVVKLDEGSVVVSGPLIGDGFAVSAGQTLRVRRRAAQFELLQDSPSPTLPLPPPGADSSNPALGGDEGAEPPRDTPPAPSVIPAPSAPAPQSALPRAPRKSWRELAAAGKFRDAIEAADREGFERICAEGSAADLWALADSARLSGDIARSQMALTTLRRRFPGDAQATESAFLLGVIAFDTRGDHLEAARWFTTYLSERPRGRLAREAAGRLLEAEERSGHRAGAREAARRYLRDYPGGPHAEMAKAIAGE